ncbi:MAG TPA: hypothetical protein VGM32_12635 [Rhodopila sp.]|jgi:hypothetical protein
MASRPVPCSSKVTDSLSSFTADGAYDQEGVYAAVATLKRR